MEFTTPNNEDFHGWHIASVEFHPDLFSFSHYLKSKTSIIHFLSSHCLMNVLMRHWHDLLHQPGFFFSSFFFFFFFYQCPSHTNHNLAPTPVCWVCPWIQTPDTEPGHLFLPFFFFFFFFFPARPSAADAVCLACGKVIGAERPKVTLMKTEGAFCLSAPPSRAVHPPAPAVVWLPPCPRSPGATSTHAIRLGTCKFCHRKTASQAVHALTVTLPWQKKMSFQTQERGLISHSLSPESMLLVGQEYTAFQVTDTVRIQGNADSISTQGGLNEIRSFAS